MSQTVITLAFEKYKAQQEALTLAVELDEFVLANVPGQDSTLTIERSESVPADEQIVYIADVTQKGYVNPNAVVYSLIMDTSVGDFDFNWIGLRNKSSGVLAAISHFPLTAKYKTLFAEQNGNTITRSIMMSYSNAQSLTNINVDASTWQIDFTARLFGIDEAERIANTDHYGNATFFDNGFNITKEGDVYKASKGIGYVGGLRCELESDTTIDLVETPNAIYVDASLQGQLTSNWITTIKIASSTTDLTDYSDNIGIQHFLTKIGEISASGNITDTRKIGGTNAFERVDNSASNNDIEEESTAAKHIKLPQFWKGIAQKIAEAIEVTEKTLSDAFSNRYINTNAPLEGGGQLSENINLSITDATTSKSGVTKLSNSYSGTSESKATTEKALSDAFSNRSINTNAPLEGGGQLSGNINLSITDATTSKSGVTKLSNSYSGASESKATTEKALSEGLAEKVSNTNHSLKSYFSLEELGLTDEDFAENTLALLMSRMNSKSLAYIAIGGEQNISALMPTSNAGTLYIEKLSAWQFTLKFVELYKHTPTPYITSSFTDNSPGSWVKLQNGEKSTHITLAEDEDGWGAGTIVDWSATSYVRDDFDFILITGKDTSDSGAAGAGNVSALINKTFAKSNGRINLLSRSRANDYADYLILQTSAIGATSMEVFVQKKGLLDGVITGIYGIKL